MAKVIDARKRSRKMSASYEADDSGKFAGHAGDDVPGRGHGTIWELEQEPVIGGWKTLIKKAKTKSKKKKYKK